MSSRHPHFAAALLALWAIAIAISVRAADEPRKESASRVAQPVVKIARGDKCVEPTDIMRRDHMKFILHQRDDTMHKGIRTTKHSLANCVSCHADPKTNSVLGKDGFCQSCHTYTAVSIDCFTCHSASPEKTAASSDNMRPPGTRTAP